MADPQVRIWRPADEERVLLMAGRTSSYAIEPRGEYVFGLVAGEAMRSRRGRERRLVVPGQLVAWDPSAAHSGTAAEGRAWTSRLMIVEAADLGALAGEGELGVLAGLEFPRPVIDDRRLVAGFSRLHATLESPSLRLETDGLLAAWLDSLVHHAAGRRRPPAPLSPRDERALRLAYDYLGDLADRNIGLEELAAAAGVDKFRLVRLFRERTGLPPHALQLAHRIRTARRLLEAGQTIGEAAAATGFADQSHLHRHFRRSLGMTPGQYLARLRR